MKFGLFLLAAVFVLCFGPTRVSACKYCEMALDPSLRMDFSTPDASPTPAASVSASALQTVPPVPLQSAASPAPVSHATKLAALGLPTTALPVHPPVSPAPTTAKPSANTVDRSRRTGMRWADLGLLGIVAVGGVFCWRTRRAA